VYGILTIDWKNVLSVAHPGELIECQLVANYQQVPAATVGWLTILSAEQEVKKLQRLDLHRRDSNSMCVGTPRRRNNFQPSQVGQ
jgi:hypothetical protein